MTAQVTMRQQPARSQDDQVVILNAGISAIPTIAFQPTPWAWDLLCLQLGQGYTLETAEVCDSYIGLYQACQAATELTRRAKLAGERVMFVVQRHTPVEEPVEAVEF